MIATLTSESPPRNQRTQPAPESSKRSLTASTVFMVFSPSARGSRSRTARRRRILPVDEAQALRIEVALRRLREAHEISVVADEHHRVGVRIRAVRNIQVV